MYIKKQVSHSNAYIGILAVFSILFSVAAVFASYSFGNLINGIAEISSENMLGKILPVALFFACQCILEYGYFAIRGVFFAHGSRRLQCKCEQSLLGASVPWIRRQNSGDIMGRLQTELQMSASLLCETLPDLILQGIRILLFSSVIAFINWRLAVLYLCVIAIIAIAQTLLSKPIQSNTKQAQEKRAEANSTAREIISQRVTIKSYSAHSLVLRWYEGALNSWLKASIKTEMVASPLRTLGWVCGIAPTFMLCIMGAVFVQNGALSFASFMTIYFLAEQMTNDCMHYIDLFIQYRKGAASAKRLCEIIDAPQEGFFAEDCKIAEEINAPAIAFDKVSFSYGEGSEDGKQRALSEVSFEIGRGEKVAFVGESGSGKSTLLGIAQGFLTAESGNVYICGHQYNAEGGESARRRVSFIPQSPFMFAETVQSNITFGREISGDDLNAVYENAGVSAFVGALPNGDKTGIGGDGISLSTGQQQRIAIARGLVKNAPIILMDEATSALDAQSDKKIFDTIARLPAETAALVVTHRLTYLQNFDMIYVMRGGQIVESGKHETLLGAGGAYAHLWHSQEAI